MGCRRYSGFWVSNSVAYSLESCSLASLSSIREPVSESVAITLSMPRSMSPCRPAHPDAHRLLHLSLVDSFEFRESRVSDFLLVVVRVRIKPVAPLRTLSLPVTLAFVDQYRNKYSSGERPNQSILRGKSVPVSIGSNVLVISDLRQKNNATAHLSCFLSRLVNHLGRICA